MDLEILISFIIATATLAIAPGPDTMFVLIQTITYGKKQGIAIVCGLISGCLVHTTLVAFGLSSFIKSKAELLLVLKLFGVGYMLYLAYGAYKSTKVLNTDIQAVKSKSLWALFKQGFIMNVINPKVSIFFMAFFPAFLYSQSLSLVLQFYTLGFLFMLTSFMIFSMLVFFSSSVSSILKTNPTFEFVIKWAQILMFLGIAFFILFIN